VVVDGDGEGALGCLLADYVLLQDLVDLTRFGQVLEFDRGGSGELLVDDLVAEVDALVADIDAGAGDQLLDLALRLAAEAAKELLIGVCGTCQLNPLLAGLVVAYRRRNPQLRGGGAPAISVWSFTSPALPSLPLTAALRRALALDRVRARGLVQAAGGTAGAFEALQRGEDQIGEPEQQEDGAKHRRRHREHGHRQIGLAGAGITFVPWLEDEAAQNREANRGKGTAD
jgi:hypothetical protein